MDIRLDIDSIPEDDSAFLVQPNARKDKEQHWPFIFWIYLKTIGLYHNAPLVTIRRCNACKEKGLHNFASISSYISPCDICESFLWDHTGQVNHLKDKEIGASRLNHPGSTCLSIVWLLVILCSVIYLILYNILRFRKKQG